MKSLRPLLPLVLVIAACGSKPVVRDADLRIADMNVLGGTYIVCGSAISWDGVNFTLEGLDVSGASASKKYTIGKINYKPEQIREINNIALSIDAIFRQMCTTTILLRKNPEALAKYVVDRDRTALSLFKTVGELEAINKRESNAVQVIEEQKKAFDTATKTDN